MFSGKIVRPMKKEKQIFICVLRQDPEQLEAAERAENGGAARRRRARGAVVPGQPRDQIFEVLKAAKEAPASSARCIDA